jgi:hypothetical protein
MPAMASTASRFSALLDRMIHAHCAKRVLRTTNVSLSLRRFGLPTFRAARLISVSVSLADDNETRGTPTKRWPLSAIML